MEHFASHMFQFVKNAYIWTSGRRYLKTTQLKMNAEMVYLYVMKYFYIYNVGQTIHKGKSRMHLFKACVRYFLKIPYTSDLIT